MYFTTAFIRNQPLVQYTVPVRTAVQALCHTIVFCVHTGAKRSSRYVCGLIFTQPYRRARQTLIALMLTHAAGWKHCTSTDGAWYSFRYVRISWAFSCVSYTSREATRVFLRQHATPCIIISYEALADYSRSTRVRRSPITLAAVL